MPNDGGDHQFPSERLVRLIDGINKIVQIMALVVAGVWAVHVYTETTEPSLENKEVIDTSVEWNNDVSEDSCVGTFTTMISNDGITPFDIDRYEVKAWLSSVATITKQPSGNTVLGSREPVLIDPKAIMQSEPFFKIGYEDPNAAAATLSRHYGAGAHARQSWDWIFPKNPGEVVLFQIVTKAAGNNVFRKFRDSEMVCSNSTKNPSSDKSSQSKK